MLIAPVSVRPLLFRSLMACAAFLSMTAQAVAQNDVDALRADAAWLLDLIDEQYAYLDRFGGQNPARDALGVDISAINTPTDLLRFSECALNSLKDHHAIMGVSAPDSPGIVPSYSDIWIELRGDRYVVTEVRSGSPAERAGVVPGYALIGVNGIPVNESIDTLCGGPYETDADRSFAARMISVGRRDRPRDLRFETPSGEVANLELASLYTENTPWPGPITADLFEDSILILTLNDSLGEDSFVSAIADALQGQSPAGVIIDLRDTPGGGNTLNARALMGRFVNEPTGYQRHSIPAIEQRTGIPRHWVEEVSPLGPDLSDIPLVVLVGRWTGSMGEGTAIGLDAAANATIVGAPMAQLRGAIFDIAMPNTGWIVKLPTEALFHVDGRPREAVMPEIIVDDVEARGGDVDRGMDAALAEIRRQIANK